MKGGLGHFYTHIWLNWAREPPKDGEMNKMTLPYRHRMRNSSPGGLKPSTLPLVFAVFSGWMAYQGLLARQVTAN